MLHSLIALSLLQGPASAAAPPQQVQAQAPQQLQGWTVANQGGGCLVHTERRGGTMLSVMALPGQDGIGFLLQNSGWTSLEDGTAYPITIRFDGGRAWQLPALARTNIDADGPGVYFVVSPGSESGGQEFIRQFAAAQDMSIANGGVEVERLGLTDSRGATVAIAQCLSRNWNGEESAPEGEGDQTTLRI